MPYERVVAAALADTQSMFKFAEALALDIPERKRGPKDVTVQDELEQVRQRIFQAGGEPRSVRTLESYRETALWVSRGNTGNFRWVAGASYTAHEEARRKMSYDQFVALDDSERKARVIRAGYGAPSKDGPPESVVPSWSPEQKAGAAAALLKDPTVVAKLDDDDLDKASEAVQAARKERALPDVSAKKKLSSAKVASDVDHGFTLAMREIEKSINLLEQAIAEGVHFDDIDWQGMAIAPERLDPVLVRYRKTVAMAQVWEEQKK